MSRCAGEVDGGSDSAAAPSPLAVTPPLSPRALRTRTGLLEAAARVLGRSGYHGASVDVIAREADLPRSGLYYYFGSLDDLLEEALAGGLERAESLLAGALAESDGADPVARIRLAIEVHLRSFLVEPAYVAMVVIALPTLPPALRSRLRSGNGRYAGVWRGLLDDGLSAAGALDPDLEPHTAVMMILGALNWSAQNRRLYEGTIADLTRTAQDVLIRGLVVR